MKNRNVVILTGMHRSGTSFLSRFLANSGINMGENLVGPHPSNPLGHFEDAEILDFHRSALRREFNGEDQWVPDVPRLNEADRKIALKLLAERQQNNRLWGWKEPRTCLFLDFWFTLLPKTLFLFVFRDPLDVVDSLSRRHPPADGDWKSHNLYWRLRIMYRSWRSNNAFLRSWILYNSRLLEFYRKNRQCCFLFSLERALSEPDRLVRTMTELTGHPFSREAFDNSFDKTILHHRKSDPRCSPFLRFQARRLYKNLASLSEI